MLFFTREAERRMAQICEKGYPYEICGMLLGKEAPERRVLEVFECRNLNREKPQTRYDLDPKDYLEGERKARKEGLSVLGIFHSHPDHPDRPSETDRQAAWPYFSYVIASVQKGRMVSFRSWRLEETQQRFQEEPVKVEDTV